MHIFDCTGVSTPNTQVVQESTVFLNGKIWAKFLFIYLFLLCTFVLFDFCVCVIGMYHFPPNKALFNSKESLIITISKTDFIGFAFLHSCQAGKNLKFNHVLLFLLSLFYRG